MANYDSAEPVSSSLSSIYSTDNVKGNTGIGGNTFAKFETITQEVQVGGGGTTLTPIYRGLVEGNYVTSVGSPPVGATFVTIIGFQ